MQVLIFNPYLGKKSDSYFSQRHLCVSEHDWGVDEGTRTTKTKYDPILESRGEP